MSRKNSLENKRARRAEREQHSTMVEKRRRVEARLKYLAYAPPDTYEDLDAEVAKVLEDEGL